MANFTTISIAANTGTNGSPTWTALGGAGTEWRWSDVGTGLLTTASAAWPAITRPAVTGGVAYSYAATADAVLLGVLGSAGDPTTWDNSKYLQSRIQWDNVGTFAAAPVFTAYASSSHAAISRGDGSICGGHATDTGATARSYIKGALFGRVVSAGAPAAAVGSDAVVTDGTTGSVSPTAGANWSVYQGLQGDNDYITAAATPAAVTADQLNTMIRLFLGPNITPGTLTPVLSLKYSWT